MSDFAQIIWLNQLKCAGNHGFCLIYNYIKDSWAWKEVANGDLTFMASLCNPACSFWVLCHDCQIQHSVFDIYAMKVKSRTLFLSFISWKSNPAPCFWVSSHKCQIQHVRFDFHDMIAESYMSDLNFDSDRQFRLRKCNLICSKRFDLQYGYIKT